MIKKITAVLMVVGLGTSAFALENGKYNCVVNALSYNGLTKKLPEDKWQKLSFTKKGQEIVDAGGEVFKYIVSSNDGNVDIYKNKKFLVAVPGYDVGKKMFRMNFEDKSKMIYNCECLRIK